MISNILFIEFGESLRCREVMTNMEGLVLGTDGTMADYCDVLRTRKPEDTLSIEVLRFATKEYLSGQLNGRTLETSFSYADKLGDEVSAGTAGSYEDFATVQDDYGAIQVSVPTIWSQVDGNPWLGEDGEILGSSITATANRERWDSGYDEPGIFFGVSDEVAKLAGYIQLLDEYRSVFKNTCEYGGRFDYEDSAFEGAYDVYNNCDGSGDTAIILSARPQVNKTSFLVTLLFNAMTDADLEVLDEVLNSFDVVGTLP